MNPDSWLAGDFAIDGYVARNGALAEPTSPAQKKALRRGGGEFWRSPFRNLVHSSFCLLAFAIAARGRRGTARFRRVQRRRHLQPATDDAGRACDAVTPGSAVLARAHGGEVVELTLSRRILLMLLPLQELDPILGGLEVAPLAATKAKLYADEFRDSATGLIALTPNDAAGLCGDVPMLKRGGVIGFTQLNVHRGTPNRSARIRWSMSSPSGRYCEDNYEQWRDRCLANAPAG